MLHRGVVVAQLWLSRGMVDVSRNFLEPSRGVPGAPCWLMLAHLSPTLRNFGIVFKNILVILGGVLQMLILAVVPKVKCLKDNITTTI